MTGDEARSLIAAALRPAIEANWPNHDLAPIEWRYGRWSDEYRRASSGRTQVVEDAVAAVVESLREAGVVDA